MLDNVSASSAVKAKDIIDLTTEIVASYVSNHRVDVADIPNLIQTVRSGLVEANQPASSLEPVALVPAVSIKKSITPDYLVCLEDGKKLKMLKRYLRSTYDMTPEQYRTKWGLPRDYPMVAPNYAATRSEFAKSIGLGRNSSATTAQEAPKRGRRKAA